MTVLPDIGGPGVTLVICGEQAGPESARVGHYYAGSGNRFWQTLLQIGLVTDGLGFQDDGRLPEYGIGLTDIKKSTVHGDKKPPSAEDRQRFFELVEAWNPPILAFHGIGVAKSVLDRVVLSCGPVKDTGLPAPLAHRSVHVLTSTSGQNKHFEEQFYSWLVLAREFRKVRGEPRTAGK
jgi:double-stranded uracil-DNA glycosylase